MTTLQILHASDLEGGVDAIANAPNFAAIVDALETDAAEQGITSILLSAGDNYIPGPFFNAGGDFSLSTLYEGFYNELFGLIDVSIIPVEADTNGDGFFDNNEIEALINAGTLTFDAVYTTDVNGDGFADYFEEIDTFEGRLDIAIMNRLGFDASAVGNHEFDAGTDAFENAINYDSEEGNGLSGGRFGTVNFLQEVDTPGVQFPYLAANLDFSQDFDVGPLFTSEILPSSAFVSDLLSARVNPADPAETGSDSNDAKIAPATILEVDGEQIGVLGATTQLIAQISSTGNIDDFSSPGTNDMAALAAVLQPVIDELVGQGINKIVLVSHLQQFALETELAGLLSGVDVIVAGGSDTILADETDRLRPGDVADINEFPVIVDNADGDPTALLSTAGEYSYVGRLVVEFDDNGVIIPDSIDPVVSGAFATDDQGVLDVTTAATVTEAIAASDKATDVANLVAGVTQIVTDLDGEIAGESAVFLNGLREFVRTEETNLGNLTADANLVAAKAFDPEVTVSLKNGGGIRAPIGQIIGEPDGSFSTDTTAANPLAGKEAGEVSELDIDNALRFDNGLVIVDLTAEQLKIVLEHGVAATTPTGTPGQFPQVGGLHFSFDPNGTAQVLGEGGEVVVAGTRVQNISLVDENGVPTQAIVRDGEVVEGAPNSIKVVTLDFLAGGGDGYPFADFSDVIDIGVGEQQALSDFLTENFPEDGPDAFNIADTEPGRDARIQILTERSDTVDAPIATQDLVFEVVAEFQGEGGGGASEVVAQEAGQLFVTNGELGRIDIFDIASDSFVTSIDLTGLEGFDGVQSVAVANGVVAAAVARGPEDVTIFGETFALSQPGFVAFFDAGTQELLSTVDVGTLPDSITFTEDGSTLIVAGEGEKNEDSDNDDDPLGTIGLVDLTDVTAPVVELVDFTAFNGLEDEAREAGIRILEDASIAEDLEPEFVTVTADGTVFASLQENNAIAEIDIETGTVSNIFSLGLVDFSETALDANDNGIIEIQNFDNLVGFRMADGIDAFEVNGETFIATANEGDSRDFDEARVSDLFEEGLLDEALVAELIADGSIDEDPDTDIGIERLEVSTIDGDTDGDGDIDVIHAFNSRSFSIFDTAGNLVFDSGSDFEKIIAEIAPERFNDDDGDDGEDRSDAKGPEPEAVTIGEVDGELYAFIALERDSGIMIYNVSEPADAFFVNYIPPIFTDLAADDEIARQGPEVITFISADESTTGNAQIAVAYEISGSTVVYDLSSPVPEVTIAEIQGAGHISPFVGADVTTSGIVTAVDFNGYYLQSAVGDGDDATSDGIFVFTGTGSESPVAVGDEVQITGTVSEFIPGGAGTGNLSTTQISTAEAEILSSGNDLPEAVVIGAAGRAAPTEVVISEDELPVNLQEEPGVFNPETDGIDFYESLEGMRVTIDNPVAVSATNQFNETWVVTDDGALVTTASGGLNDRGGLNLNANADGFGDLNPERVQVQFDAFFDLLPEGFTPPDINLGDDLSDVTGVVGYSFGNFEVLVTEAFEIESPSENTPEVTTIAGDEDTLTFAAYNILNVTANPADGDEAQIALLAEQIVNNLGSPDILALQEVQDDSGVTDDGTLDATMTLQAIVDAIEAAGGPAYEFVSAVVDEDGETGGVPGGNIRNAFLYNPERVDAEEFVTLEVEELTELGVTNPNAFDGTRDPLLGVFTFNDTEITLINNHLTSRFGSQPIFGGPQPFFQAGEAEREQETLALNEVVDALLADDPEANIVVLGDLNTFEFTDELTEDLPGVGDEQVLTNLIDQLPGDEAYTFVFQGNSQVLDHIFVTDGLLDGAQIDIAHVNNDFVDFASDHEPVIASVEISGPEDLILVGTAGTDVLVGESGDDIIRGLGGDDILLGGDGDDAILGGSGDDLAEGEDGDDLIQGGEGNDTLLGGAGDDILRGGAGMDLLIGGEGNDIVVGGSDADVVVGGTGDDILLGGTNQDVFVLEGMGGNDTVLDYRPDWDAIELSGLGVTDFDDVLSKGVQEGTTAVFTFDDGTVLNLADVDLDELSAADFMITV